MGRFLYSSILVAVATAAVRAAPTIGDFARVKERPTTSNDLYQLVLKTSGTIDSTAEFLMVGSLFNGSSGVNGAARDGLFNVEYETIGWFIIQDDLDHAGESSVKPDLTDIINVNKNVTQFYHTIVAQQPPDPSVAQDCGLAIACSRNAIVQKINTVLDKYNDVVVGDREQPPANVSAIAIPTGPDACTQPRTSCPDNSSVLE
ncbi:hypothetical protein F5Y05DRAFT_67198 [Hypoxylon sp. FL0543]|nr:hypothetical protein F5Y05DRAFT_67198 [Hypoxylon sp. FL0543]